MVAQSTRRLESDDPTLCPPDLQQEIESYYGVRLDQADPQQLKLVVDQSKASGNSAFRERRFKGTQGLTLAVLDPESCRNQTWSHLLRRRSGPLLDGLQIIKAILRTLYSLILCASACRSHLLVQPGHSWGAW